MSPGICFKTRKGQGIHWDQTTCFPWQMQLGQPDGFPWQKDWVCEAGESRGSMSLGRVRTSAPVPTALTGRSWEDTG